MSIDVMFLVLQVKLAYQESELVTLLKKIPLGAQELAVIRERAERLRDGKLQSRGEALLPLMLAGFIFDSLCLPCKSPSALSSTRSVCPVSRRRLHLRLALSVL